jgi:hypothetical protein
VVEGERRDAVSGDRSGWPAKTGQLESSVSSPGFDNARVKSVGETETSREETKDKMDWMKAVRIVSNRTSSREHSSGKADKLEEKEEEEV